MYNRYTPQSDGSYRKNRIPDQRNEGNIQPKNSDIPKKHYQTESAYSQAPIQEVSHNPPPKGTNVEGFLRQLLPKDFDTGDLLVIILLLLMSGENKENQNNALLTLALYLFM